MTLDQIKELASDYATTDRFCDNSQWNGQVVFRILNIGRKYIKTVNVTGSRPVVRLTDPSIISRVW